MGEVGGSVLLQQLLQEESGATRKIINSEGFQALRTLGSTSAPLSAPQLDLSTDPPVG